MKDKPDNRGAGNATSQGVSDSMVLAKEDSSLKDKTGEDSGVSMDGLLLVVGARHAFDDRRI
jgi:hypothetical protein